MTRGTDMCSNHHNRKRSPLFRGLFSHQASLRLGHITCYSIP